jgi:large subunit ribosomal protein L51
MSFLLSKLTSNILQVKHIISEIATRGIRQKPVIANHGLKHTKYFKGGLLPRIQKNEFEEELPMPLPKHASKDSWSEKYATFGQNDYIDILGNGNIKPVDLIQGPSWLVGFRGNELQRLLRYRRMEGGKLLGADPLKHHFLNKRIKFLYKKFNYKFGGKKK